jgi:hypothetical protein
VGLHRDLDFVRGRIGEDGDGRGEIDGYGGDHHEGAGALAIGAVGVAVVYGTHEFDGCAIDGEADAHLDSRRCIGEADELLIVDLVDVGGGRLPQPVGLGVGLVGGYGEVEGDIGVLVVGEGGGLGGGILVPDAFD